MQAGVCSECGCTDRDCSRCLAVTGVPCFWVNPMHTLCSRCAEGQYLRPKPAYELATTANYDALIVSRMDRQPLSREELTLLFAGLRCKLDQAEDRAYELVRQDDRAMDALGWLTATYSIAELVEELESRVQAAL